jgi:hypothetical protein
MRIMLIAAVAAALVTVSGYITSWFTRAPGSNCSTKPISETWAQDRAYKATLLVRDCNMEETIFYTVRVDAFSPPLRNAWFTIEEIDDDECPDAPPVVHWDGPRTLVSEMRTKTLRGSLVRNIGQDLIMRITYARSSNAFPN